MYILNIPTPSSAGEMGSHLNQILGYDTQETANLDGQFQQIKSLGEPYLLFTTIYI